MASRILSRMSTADLRRELDRRTSQLAARRKAIESELAQVDAEIEAMGRSRVAARAAPTGRKPRASKRKGGISNAARTRSENTVTLTEALQKALKGKVLGVAEVADAVAKSGYKSRARNFRTIVNLTLLKRKDLFVKKGRGQYTNK